MNIGLLLAAGESNRFGSDKLFALIKDKPIIYHSLKFLEESPYVNVIFIAANPKNKKKISHLVKEEGFKKAKKILLGGHSRFQSVLKLTTQYHPAKRGIQLRRDKVLTIHYLIIHNAANPLATHEELENCFRVLQKNPSISGVAVGRPIISTVKKTQSVEGVRNLKKGSDVPVHQNIVEFIETTMPRTNLWETETPQVVRARDFLKACGRVMVREPHHDTPTDDLALLEAAGFKTAIIPVSPYNRKITIPEDLEMVKFFAGDVPNEYRVGIGEDSHRFSDKWQVVKGKCLILGGVKIKNMPRLIAESDGDVVMHALCNAIASAIGERSLGTYATTMCKQGIRDSKKYLEKVLDKIQRKKFQLLNCAISIEAARPKIDPIISKIKTNLSTLLIIPTQRIGITATSGEKLTTFGRGKGIRCMAIVSIKQR